MTSPPADATAIYLYCLLRDREPPDLVGVPAGLPGTGPPRLLDAGGDLWLVVAEAPMEEISGEVLEARLQDLSWVSTCAVAHEMVVEHFLGAEALVPLKLLTLFSSEAQALEHLGRRRESLEEILERVSGHREWGVRVRLLPEDLRPGAAGSDPPPAPASGREFLLRKRQRHRDIQAHSQEARQGAEQTWHDLEALATAAQRRPPLAPELETRMLMEASFLVPVARAEAFEAAVARCAELLAQARCELTLTGPWPPYSFVEEAS